MNAPHRDHTDTETVHIYRRHPVIVVVYPKHYGNQRPESEEEKSCQIQPNVNTVHRVGKRDFFHLH